MIKIRLKIDIDMNNFDEYVHVPTFALYSVTIIVACPIKWIIMNKNYIKCSLTHWRALYEFFALKELILLSDKLFETGITKKLENILLFLLLRS